jgi:hypothetical protein
MIKQTGPAFFLFLGLRSVSCKIIRNKLNRMSKMRNLPVNNDSFDPLVIDFFEREEGNCCVRLCTSHASQGLRTVIIRSGNERMIISFKALDSMLTFISVSTAHTFGSNLINHPHNLLAAIRNDFFLTFS